MKKAFENLMRFEEKIRKVKSYSIYRYNNLKETRKQLIKEFANKFEMSVKNFTIRYARYRKENK